ncbi:hypothetical protein sos41_01340 [Alphaproteobacteria bacterium SO-S41]|nr:hypothetical protein sos41_01340 [Alphaproteobacteria bacterium SO-S41]
MSERRFWLRDKTAPSHRALEGMVGPLDTIPAYSHFVEGLYRGRQPVESWLKNLAWPELFKDWRPILIGPALAKDLADLDRPLPPLAPFTPPGATVSDLLGVLYVLEGSSLGARVVLRQALALGLDAGFGARHLALQASDGGWPHFVRLLDSADHPDMERVGRAAVATFDAMHQAMSGHVVA